MIVSKDAFLDGGEWWFPSGSGKKRHRATIKVCVTCGEKYTARLKRQKCCTRRCSSFQRKDMRYKNFKGRGKSGQGYIVVWVDPKDELSEMRGKNGRCLEHRFVMARALGRPLKNKEQVHHINGIRDDNRLENLELWSGSHPAGKRVEDLVAWAHQIIDLYESAPRG